VWFKVLFLVYYNRWLCIYSLIGMAFAIFGFHITATDFGILKNELLAEIPVLTQSSFYITIKSVYLQNDGG